MVRVATWGHNKKSVIRRANRDYISSVARGGGAGGGSSPPHWLVKYAKTHVFCAFEADFLWKMENSPPPYEKSPPSNVWTCEIGRKIALKFGEDLFFFFGDHLILGGKNVWTSDLSETFRLKFRTNRLKLIQGQWKFESTSFAHFSLFQNSPPLFQILATRLDYIEVFHLTKI